MNTDHPQAANAAATLPANAAPVQANSAPAEQANSGDLNFRSINVQARFIAYLYNVLGLWSILALTVASVIAMTNVFTRGAAASWPAIDWVWGALFAAAIDVNIPRMFVEGYLTRLGGHKGESRAAFLIGGGLAAVTAISLFLEGLQQAVGLSWNLFLIQVIIGIILGLRVLIVVVLMAREGVKLGRLVYAAAQAQMAAEQRHVQKVNSAPRAARAARAKGVQKANSAPAPQPPNAEQGKVVQIGTRTLAEAERRTEALSAVRDNPEISARALAARLALKSPSSGKEWKAWALAELSRTAVISS